MGVSLRFSFFIDKYFLYKNIFKLTNITRAPLE